jgi:CheY-like chemotaxis protein
VTVAVAAVRGGVEISVVDTGPGIDPEFLPHVFNRFRQQDASTTRRHGGLGSGLAIAQQLAEQHGGKIRVGSPGPGGGANFVLMLPLMQAADPVPTTPTVETALGQVDLPLAGISVLVIDDEPDARDMAAFALGHAGAQALSAGGAVEGLEILHRSRPDVVVCDIGMPVNDGYDFVRWVRGLPEEEGGKTPVVAFTAFSRPVDRQRAVAEGFHLHLSKPAAPGELIDVVAALKKTAR